MKREEFYRGKRGAKYGIWNREKAAWQFDIREDTPFLAVARLHQKIGDDAKKWRFEPRRLPDGKITLVKRIKYAGDVHSALLALGWDLDTATSFVNSIPDAK